MRLPRKDSISLTVAGFAATARITTSKAVSAATDAKSKNQPLITTVSLSISSDSKKKNNQRMEALAKADAKLARVLNLTTARAKFRALRLPSNKSTLRTRTRFLMRVQSILSMSGRFQSNLASTQLKRAVASLLLRHRRRLLLSVLEIGYA